MLDELERKEVRGSAETILARSWPSALSAGDAEAADRLAGVWAHAARAGWTGFAGASTLAATVEVAMALGHVGCPLPVGDIHATASLLAAHPQIVQGIEDGTIRAIVVAESATAGSAAFPVEAAAAATHVVVLPLGAGAVRVASIAHRDALEGLAAPPWSRVTLGDDLIAFAVDAERSDAARGIVRLALAASALGAAAAAHDLAIAHAIERRQFGRQIGAFQAVQHRLADAAIDVSGGELLLREAAASHDVGRGSWGLAAGLAVAHVLMHAARIQLRAHHTLAATGYFEAHPAPWLFRRVHADVLRARTLPLGAGEPFDILVESGQSLPELEIGEAGERTRAAVRRFLDDHPTDGSSAVASDDPAFVSDLAEAGFLALALAPEHGGRRAGVEELVAVQEELSYRRAPAAFAMAAAQLFGPAIERFGTPDQQERFLPLLAGGQLPFYLGYSEPEIGSDLASLSTRAVRDGDEWVITGQKSWGTGADRARWVWLAARTDPQASPRRDGITVFLFPTNLPGWNARPDRALSGEVSCATFFDDVRIPDSARVGEVNQGWAVITAALAAERLVMAGHTAELRRQFDELLEIVREQPALVGPRGSARRERWSELAARLQAGRVLFRAGLGAMAAGKGGWLQAPMAKVVTGDLAEDFGEAALELLGPAGALAAGQPGAVGDGRFEFGLRLAPMYVIGGGTADIQRNLIARGLGLPRGG